MPIQIRKAEHPFFPWNDDPFRARFIEKIDVTDPLGCWPWKAKKDKDGYGLFSIDGRFHKAHRIALILCGIELDGVKIVRHLCGNPSCVNPAHLRESDQKQNAADRTRHGRDGGRKRTGANNGRSKLSATQVQQIRQSSESLAVLARRYGVTKTAIGHIRKNKTWKQQSN